MSAPREFEAPRLGPAGSRGARTSLTDSSEYEPSGSRAGMSTALCRAYTPGLGSGVRRAPWENLRIDNSRWLSLSPSRSRCARTMAPRVAMISRAPVSSKAQRYRMKMSSARPSTLPPALACSTPTKAVTEHCRCPRSGVSRIRGRRRSRRVRCPRRVSARESDESTPTSMRTKRNSIITAPVYTTTCATPRNKAPWAM